MKIPNRRVDGQKKGPCRVLEREEIFYLHKRSSRITGDSKAVGGGINWGIGEKKGDEKTWDARGRNLDTSGYAKGGIGSRREGLMKKGGRVRERETIRRSRKSRETISVRGNTRQGSRGKGAKRRAKGKKTQMKGKKPDISWNTAFPPPRRSVPYLRKERGKRGDWKGKQGLANKALIPTSLIMTTPD